MFAAQVPPDKFLCCKKYLTNFPQIDHVPRPVGPGRLVEIAIMLHGREAGPPDQGDQGDPQDSTGVSGAARRGHGFLGRDPFQEKKEARSGLSENGGDPDLDLGLLGELGV